MQSVCGDSCGRPFTRCYVRHPGNTAANRLGLDYEGPRHARRKSLGRLCLLLKSLPFTPDALSLPFPSHFQALHTFRFFSKKASKRVLTSRLLAASSQEGSSSIVGSEQISSISDSCLSRSLVPSIPSESNTSRTPFNKNSKACFGASA